MAPEGAHSRYTMSIQQIYDVYTSDIQCQFSRYTMCIQQIYSVYTADIQCVYSRYMDCEHSRMPDLEENHEK